MARAVPWPHLGDRFLIRTVQAVIEGLELGSDQCSEGVNVSQCEGLLQYCTP
jgi:hypothetical protein